jgi:hypothetical protein
LSGYSIFMAAAFAALIYELDDAAHAAPAFNFGDGLVDIFTSSTASDANGLAAATPNFADFFVTNDGTFRFDFAGGDMIAGDGSQLYVGDARAEDGRSDRGNTIPHGSGTDNIATANEAPQSDPNQGGSNQGRSQPDLRSSDNGSGAAKEHEAAGDQLNYGQSQKALHESDNGSGAAKGHAMHEDPGDGLNDRQSQKALHESDNGSGAAKGHAMHEDPGDDSNHGRAHGDLQTFEDGSAAGEQHAHHPQADADKPKHDLSMASVVSANDAHSDLKVKTAGKSGPSSDDAGQGKSTVGAELGDSFHFKNEANSASSDMLNLQQQGHGIGKAHGENQRAAAHEGLVPVQDADAIDLSVAQHDHSGHANFFVVHDLIV